MLGDNNQPNAETVEVIADQNTPGALWTPFVGPETIALLNHLRLPDASNERLQQEAVTVLSRCIPPTAANSTTTGLVIGYIQSGKTMSFTTVASLARDNGYRLIIVITGVNRNLFAQSTDRLQRDLRLNERRDRRWQFFANPSPDADIRQRIANALAWDDSLPEIGSQTVLITVLKNSTRLRNLIALLTGIQLAGIPALVIDDEADQASLNTQARTRGQSTIYRRIQNLRQLLPHHTFLQYTATPQALLLINIIDALSPSFVAVLTPGAAYTGGRTFFEGDFDLIRRIPPDEILQQDQPIAEPPTSLVESMREFYLGVAAGLMAIPEDNRSMMIHPAKEVQQHAVFVNWVRELQRNWAQIISLPAKDPDRCELVEDFEAAHSELSTTVNDLPPFINLLPYLAHALRVTAITEVNATRAGRQPDWRQQYSHILIGGEVLNRGYTVEGLTVTYMPRSIGMGQADTIQQRARWFGYKANYLGYCRVYLSDEVRQAYEDYVEHEEDIRRQLREFAASGRNLQEWSRVLRLSANLQPTRSNVVARDYLRGNFSNTWYVPSVPYGTPEADQNNRVAVDEFLASLNFEPDEGHPRRTDEQKHLLARGVSLDRAYSEFLSRIQLSNPDEWQRYTGMLKQISDYLEDLGDEACTVFLMSGGRLRIRSLDNEGKIPTLFQGPNPDRSGEYYPGDRQIRAREGLTIQIHKLTIRKEGAPVADNVPAIAVWVPRAMSQSWLVQDQGIR